MRAWDLGYAPAAVPVSRQANRWGSSQEGEEQRTRTRGKAVSKSAFVRSLAMLALWLACGACVTKPPERPDWVPNGWMYAGLNDADQQEWQEQRSYQRDQRAGGEAPPLIYDNNYLPPMTESSYQDYVLQAERQAESQAQAADSAHKAAEQQQRWKQESSARAAAASQEVQAKAKERSARETELRVRANEHGYSGIVLGIGLAGTLREIVNEGRDLSTVRDLAIELGGYDFLFAAVQVLPTGQALFATQSMRPERFVLRGYKGPVYEGTMLRALHIEAVKIVGVVTYVTTAGGTAQAFVIEAAW